jgi:DNA-binding transcriptional LysR family regulator
MRSGAPEDYPAFPLPPVLASFAQAHPLAESELTCER